MMLIADSGSTKTDWRLVTADGSVQTLHTDGFNPYYQNTETIIDSLRLQLLPQINGAAVQNVFFYGAGCSGPSVNIIVADALRAVFPNLVTVHVNSDMLGAARGAAGREAAIVCILGTGANACCCTDGQITRGIQTLGFWLGDEGSGGYLGKTLVRDYFQERLPDDLRSAFAERYALDRATLLENAYQKPFPNRYFASFTPFLTEHLAHPYVNTLVKEAFRSFLTIYVRRFPEAGEWPVHFVGSIAYYFADQLSQVTAEEDMTVGHILKAPAERLVEFHRL